MVRFGKPLVFLLCLIPLGLGVWDGVTGQLGANPIEAITHRTGDWTLRFVLISLAITPLRKILHKPALVRYRRMLGLFAFFYVCLHFLTYLVLDQFFDFHAIGKDILKRPYITIGFSAFLLLIPLAITSTNAMQRRLGKRWKQLHQLVYIAGLLGVLHYAWLVKVAYYRPLMYALIFIFLMSVRVWYQRRDTQSKPVIPV